MKTVQVDTDVELEKANQAQREKDRQNYESYLSLYKSFKYECVACEDDGCGSCCGTENEKGKSEMVKANDLNMQLPEILNKVRHVNQTRFIKEYNDDQITYHNKILTVTRVRKQLSVINAKHLKPRVYSSRKQSKVRVLEAAWKQILHDTDFIDFMEEINDITIDEGTGYVKFVNALPYFIDYEEIYYDERVRDLQDSPAIIHPAKLELDEMLDRYPAQQSDIMDFWEVLCENNTNYFIVHEYWTYTKFDGKWHKGSIHYMQKEPTQYGLPYYQSQINVSGNIEYVPNEDIDTSPKEIARYKVRKRVKNEVTGAVEEYYPFESSHDRRIRGRHHSQGTIERHLPLIANINRNYKLIDDYFLKTLNGIIAITTKNRTDKKELEEKIANGDIGTIIALMSDEKVEDLVRNSYAAEIQQAFNMIQDDINTIYGVEGVSDFSAGGDLPSSTKASTANAIVGASQVSPKDFVRKMAQFYNKCFVRHIVPYISDTMTNQKYFNISCDYDISSEDIYDLARNSVHADIKKLQKAHYKAYKKGEVATPALRQEDIELEIQKRIAEDKELGNVKPVEITKRFMKEVQQHVGLDIDGQFFESSDDMIRRTIEMATIPQVAQATKPLEFVQYLSGLYGNGDVNWIKNESEIKADQEAQQQAQAEQALATAQAQQAAGAAGVLGGAPTAGPGRPSTREGDVSLTAI